MDVFDLVRKQSGKKKIITWNSLENWTGTFDQITVGFECLVVGNHTGSRGVAVLFKNNFEHKIHSTIRDELGRDISIDFEFLNRLLKMLLDPAVGITPSSLGITSFDKANWLLCEAIGMSHLIPIIHPILIEIYPEGRYRGLLINAMVLIFYTEKQTGLFYCCVIDSVNITPCYCSDHSLVCQTFKTDIVKRQTLLEV